MTDERDPRHLRLWDIGPNESACIRCKCGRSVQFQQGALQRLRRVPSDTLLYDLQYRFRCKRCNADRDFRITLEERKTSVSAEGRIIVIVPGPNSK